MVGEHSSPWPNLATKEQFSLLKEQFSLLKDVLLLWQLQATYILVVLLYNFDEFSFSKLLLVQLLASLKTFVFTCPLLPGNLVQALLLFYRRKLEAAFENPAGSSSGYEKKMTIDFVVCHCFSISLCSYCIGWHD